MPQMINNPVIPHISSIDGGLQPGKMARIQGHTPPTAQRFNINLQCGPNVSPRDDVALHMALRIAEAYVARNSLQQQDWGQEENDGYNPIGPGQQFEILILCEPKSYKIAINGKHCCEFSHRIPLHRVSHITIDGDVSITMLNWEGAAPSAPGMGDVPQQAPPQFGGASMYGPPGGPPMGQPPYGAPGQPPYGAPGQPPYGAPGQPPYGAPGQPPYGAPGQPPYGAPGQYGPPPPPGFQPEPEKSGFDNFLGQAGTAITGLLGNSGLMGSLTGGSKPAQQPYSQPYPHGQPQGPPQGPGQQPFAGGYGGQSVGGLGSFGSLLSNAFTNTVLNKPQKKE